MPSKANSNEGRRDFIGKDHCNWGKENYCNRVNFLAMRSVSISKDRQKMAFLL